MKIEMGESLVCSWLRHEKSCQIVDTNWKTSDKWGLLHTTEIQNLLDATWHLFSTQGKSKPALASFLKQAECDVLGINFHNSIEGKYMFHAVDVAFHKAGLGYNQYDPDAGKQVNVSAARAIKKSIRTAMCLYGYLNITDAYIYFVSPKIGKKVYADLINRTKLLQAITDSLGFHFKFIVYGNNDFNDNILKPVVLLADTINNDNELWLRSFQLTDSCAKTEKIKLVDILTNPVAPVVKGKKSVTTATAVTTATPGVLSIANYAKQIADKINAGKVTDQEILDMQDKAMSNNTFRINFPLLVKATNLYPKERYYKKDNFNIVYKGVTYVFCSQWYERSRTYLDKWFDNHK